MNDDIKNSTHPSGDTGGIFRGHLRTVATGEQQENRSTVDAAPDSMRGVDFAAMLRVEEDTPPELRVEEVERVGQHTPLEDSPASSTDRNRSQHNADEPESFEIRYSDGTTDAPQAPKRSLFRRSPQAELLVDSELDAALNATTEDVWAAHRGSEHAETYPSASESDQSITCEPHAASDRPRTRAQLAVAALLLVFLAIGGIVIVATHDASAPKRRSIATGPDKPVGHSKSDEPLPFTKPTHSQAAKKHAQKRRPRGRTSTVSTTASHKAAAPTPTTETVTKSAPPTPTVPATTGDTPKSTHQQATTTNPESTSKRSTGSSTTVPASALPDVKQTDQQP